MRLVLTNPVGWMVILKDVAVGPAGPQEKQAQVLTITSHVIRQIDSSQI